MTQPAPATPSAPYVLIVTATSNQASEVVRHLKALIEYAQQAGGDYVLGMRLVQSVENPKKFVFIARYRSAEARITFRKSAGFIQWDEARKASGVFLTETYEFFNDLGIGFSQ